MATKRSVRPADVATGVISGTLAAAFFTLATLAALPSAPTASVDLLEPAVVAAASSR